ncbi:hypothetical protein ACEN88_28675, partial [Massilia sp. CT11-108]
MNESTCIDADAHVAPPRVAAQAKNANWGGIASLTLGVFGLVTAEFLPAAPPRRGRPCPPWPMSPRLTTPPTFSPRPASTAPTGAPPAPAIW